MFFPPSIFQAIQFKLLFNRLIDFQLLASIVFRHNVNVISRTAKGNDTMTREYNSVVAADLLTDSIPQ